MVTRGTVSCGWWYSFALVSKGSGMDKLEQSKLDQIISAILNLPNKVVRQKIDAAFYWVREPLRLGLDYYKSDLLRRYSAYWNAFECLVDAVNEIEPRSRLSKSEKQKQIDEFIAARRKLTTADIVECYHTIINQGFQGNGSHALNVCFQNAMAGKYINECFKLPEESDRLYKIRNAIDHGDIDAENPEELQRVESRFEILHDIVWGMFVWLIRWSLADDNLYVY